MRTLFLLVFCFSLALAAAAERFPMGREMRFDAILASVNGDPVTLLDVLLESTNAENRLQSLYQGDKLYEEIEKLRRKYLHDIVVRKLVYAEYKKKPFEIQNQHVEDLIDYLAMTMGDGTREGLEKRARAMGTNMEELHNKVREKIAVDILLAHYCERVINVTPKDVYDEYEKRVKTLTKPARISIRIMFVPKTKAKETDPDPVKVRDQLSEMIRNADDETFGKIVKANTKGPNWENGGDMGWIDMPLIRPEFAVLLKNPVKGMNAGPAETADGWYFIHVNDFEKAEIPPFESVSGKITRELRREAEEKQRKLYVEKLSRDAIISYYF